MDAPAQEPNTSAGIIASKIVIRDVTEVGDVHALLGLQMRVWGGDLSFTVPVHVLHIVSTTGGILLGAYDRTEPVGFLLGFLARRDGCLYHASHMLGIHPAYQSHGIGAALKWRQRERALEQGLDSMRWTFDPLEARNAHFNLRKLGAQARVYRLNAYGEMTDGLNRGLPTDRLEVHWDLRGRAAPRSATGAIPILRAQGDVPVLELEKMVPGRNLLIGAPPDIQRLKRVGMDIDPSPALLWRLAQRAAFTWAFERGYTVTSFLAGSYLLEPEEDHAH